MAELIDKVLESDAFTVQISGPGIEYERTIPEPTVLRIIRLVAGDGGPSTELFAGHFPRDLPQFVEDLRATTFPQRILAIAVWLAEAGVATFDRDDIRREMQSLRVRPPANFARDFDLARRKEWIAPAPDTPGRFVVTDGGMRVARSRFARA